MSDAEKLIELAKEEFKDFGEADEILFNAVAAGKPADYTEGGDRDKIESADSWGEKRIIKASRIEWLCRDRQAKEFATNKGIQVEGAKIEGMVDLSFAEIPFPLGFFRCVFTEEINIQHSRIKFINLSGSHTGSIRADEVKVEGSVHLRDGFKSEGEVRFPGAVLGGDFDCINGKFINENGKAILADRIDLKGGVFLRDGFKAEGETRFLRATIGGDFDCTKGEFVNKDGKAISADGAGIKGYVFLKNGFKAEGEVRFLGATIGRDFDCEKGEFINEDGKAIFGDGMGVKGNVFLRGGFKAEGTVSLVGAVVGGHFIWTDVDLTEKTILDLRNAKMGVLWDDEKSWPTQGNLFLDGFVYENIGDYAPKDAKSRIDWLNRQDEKQFRPGPYEQLAKVLEKIGHSEDAKRILIEKEKKITSLSGFGLWKRFWRGVVLRFTIGYGHRPWRALWFIGFFILLGFIVFGGGYKAGIIVPVEKDASPKFNAFVYSVEMFVPVVDLHMKKYWLPDANKSEILKFKKYSFHIRGDIIRWYMWVHICAGWILTTLWVVGLTGLVKK
jgi:sRNA-binding regulator protein Hfq